MQAISMKIILPIEARIYKYETQIGTFGAFAKRRVWQQSKNSNIAILQRQCYNFMIMT